MTAKISDTHRPSAEEVLAAAPPVRHEPAARERQDFPFSLRFVREFRRLELK